MLDTCLYVDDVISGADDISQALKVSKDAETIMKNASMKLRKWNSNDQTLIMNLGKGKALRHILVTGRQFQNPFVKGFRDTMGCCPRLFYN
ncbi:hypothetical protein TNCV_91171 [Trichonephila clavipes]|nr:hypothetical protein TNCV_91171 [Trichonephila clavipes]